MHQIQQKRNRAFCKHCKSHLKMKCRIKTASECKYFCKMRPLGKFSKLYVVLYPKTQKLCWDFGNTVVPRLSWHHCTNIQRSSTFMINVEKQKGFPSIILSSLSQLKEALHWTQCGSFCIFLIQKFYVKIILANSVPQNCYADSFKGYEI